MSSAWDAWIDAPSMAAPESVEQPRHDRRPVYNDPWYSKSKGHFQDFDGGLDSDILSDTPYFSQDPFLSQ